MYEIVIIGEREAQDDDASADVPLRAEGGPPVVPLVKEGTASAVILRATFAAGSIPIRPAPARSTQHEPTPPAQ